MKARMNAVEQSRGKVGSLAGLEGLPNPGRFIGSIGVMGKIVRAWIWVSGPGDFILRMPVNIEFLSRINCLIHSCISPNIEEAFAFPALAGWSSGAGH
jgi:hypothetical protein